MFGNYFIGTEPVFKNIEKVFELSVTIISNVKLLLFGNILQ